MAVCSRAENGRLKALPILIVDSCLQKFYFAWTLSLFAVRASLFRMDTREKDLILLKYMGFHSGEIGELLRLSASAVRSRSARARDHFEKFLREAGGHWEG